MLLLLLLPLLLLPPVTSEETLVTVVLLLLLLVLLLLLFLLPLEGTYTLEALEARTSEVAVESLALVLMLQLGVDVQDSPAACLAFVVAAWTAR